MKYKPKELSSYRANDNDSFNLFLTTNLNQLSNRKNKLSPKIHNESNIIQSYCIKKSEENGQKNSSRKKSHKFINPNCSKEIINNQINEVLMKQLETKINSFRNFKKNFQSENICIHKRNRSAEKSNCKLTNLKNYLKSTPSDSNLLKRKEEYKKKVKKNRSLEKTAININHNSNKKSFEKVNEIKNDNNIAHSNLRDRELMNNNRSTLNKSKLSINSDSQETKISKLKFQIEKMKEDSIKVRKASIREKYLYLYLRYKLNFKQKTDFHQKRSALIRLKNLIMKTKNDIRNIKYHFTEEFTQTLYLNTQIWPFIMKIISSNSQRNKMNVNKKIISQAISLNFIAEKRKGNKSYNHRNYIKMEELIKIEQKHEFEKKEMKGQIQKLQNSLKIVQTENVTSYEAYKTELTNYDLRIKEMTKHNENEIQNLQGKINELTAANKKKNEEEKLEQSAFEKNVNSLNDLILKQKEEIESIKNYYDQKIEELNKNNFSILKELEEQKKINKIQMDNLDQIKLKFSDPTNQNLIINNIAENMKNNRQIEKCGFLNYTIIHKKDENSNLEESLKKYEKSKSILEEICSKIQLELNLHELINENNIIKYINDYIYIHSCQCSLIAKYQMDIYQLKTNAKNLSEIIYSSGLNKSQPGKFGAFLTNLNDFSENKNVNKEPLIIYDINKSSNICKFNSLKENVENKIDSITNSESSNLLIEHSTK